MFHVPLPQISTSYCVPLTTLHTPVADMSPDAIRAPASSSSQRYQSRLIQTRITRFAGSVDRPGLENRQCHKPLLSGTPAVRDLLPVSSSLGGQATEATSHASSLHSHISFPSLSQPRKKSSGLSFRMSRPLPANRLDISSDGWLSSLF